MLELLREQHEEDARRKKRLIQLHEMPGKKESMMSFESEEG